MAKLCCIVQKDWMSVAQQRVAGYPAAVAQQIELVLGDITAEGLGLERPIEANLCFHLAAAYDLNVPRAVGMKVNVEGTTQVLRWAQQQKDFQMLHYISTCYVSGRYCGPFRETDLCKGQVFNNFYEETKYLAEVEVQRSQLPWTIYRPSVVVGNSTDGATLKYDGPYPLIKWLLRQPSFLAPMPSLGFGDRFRINMVPQDYATDALAYLCTHSETPGRVYQLCDPNPLTVQEAVEVMARCSGRRLFQFQVPCNLSKWLLGRVPAISRWSGFTPAMLDYFVHPTHYLCDHTTAALAGSGIVIPDIRQVLAKMTEYARKHPQPVG